MAQTDSLSDEHTPRRFACQEGTLVAIKPGGILRRHGYDDGIGGVAGFKEEEVDVAPGDHFGRRGIPPVYEDVLQPHG
jgi:hypothetical protein